MLLNAVLRPMHEDKKHETARRVHQRLRAIFAFAIGEGHLSRNPAIDIAEALPGVPRAVNQPALTDLGRLREMLRAVEALAAHPITKLCNRFLALVAARPGTVYQASWDEFVRLDDASAVWEVPATKMKSGKPFIYPLCRQAVEAIEAVRVLTGRSPYIFPNLRWSKKPATHGAVYMLLRRAGYQSSHCPHGYRAAFSTIMNERHRGDRHVIEFALAHVIKDRSAAPYNRAEYLDRRRELHQEWADLLLNGLSPASDLIGGRRR